MTQEELYEVVRNWSNEKIGKRATMLVMAEDIGNNSAKTSCSAMGRDVLLANGLSKAVEQNEDFAILAAMTLSAINDESFERILNSVIEARKLSRRVFDNKGK